MTRLAGTDHGVGRAARPLGIGACRVEPEPKRHADRVRTSTQEGHGAVDAAAHRDGDPTRPRRGMDHLRKRVRHGVGGQRLARDRRRLEQGQPGERPGHARCVRLHDALAVDDETGEREGVTARGVTGYLERHRSTVARASPGVGGRIRSPNLPQGHSRVPDVTLASGTRTSWCRLRTDFVPGCPAVSDRRCACRAKPRVLPSPPAPRARAGCPTGRGRGTARCPGSRPDRPTPRRPPLRGVGQRPLRAPRSSRRGAPDAPWSRV